MKKNLTSQENVAKADFLLETLDIPTLEASHKNEENSGSLLKELEEAEQELLIEKRQIIDMLVKWQSMFDSIADKKSRLMEHIKTEQISNQLNSESTKKQNSENKPSHKLFSVVTRGDSWDGLVFTVIAENDAWAENLVHQWLDSNGRKDQKIDKVMALVSRDVRGIFAVGAKLLDA